MPNEHQAHPMVMPNSARVNIETVVRLEQEFLERRTVLEKAADGVANFVGSISFVICQMLVFVVWVIVNARLVPFIPAFDPFPFPLLCLIVSLEGVILSTFVLMKQNRMSLRADQRNHLNLQVDLLAEKEITKILQVLERLSERMELGAERDTEIHELSQTTAVDELARELKEQLPE